MQEFTTETEIAFFVEQVGQFAAEQTARAEEELSVARHLLGRYTEGALRAAQSRDIAPVFVEGRGRTIGEMLDDADRSGLCVNPPNALLRFLHLHLTIAKAERDVAFFSPFTWFFVSGDEHALDWDKPETHLSFAFLFDAMLEEWPWAGVRWHDSGLKLDDLLTERAEDSE